MWTYAGESLDHFQPASLGELKHVAGESLRAILAFSAPAKGGGFVHRDIKPANIAWAPSTDGAVRLIDFSLAKTVRASVDNQFPARCYSRSRFSFVRSMLLSLHEQGGEFMTGGPKAFGAERAAGLVQEEQPEWGQQLVQTEAYALVFFLR